MPAEEVLMHYKWAVFSMFFALVAMFSPALGDESATQGGFTVTSPTFGEKEHIPRLYACDGEDINPPLVIRGIPRGTGSLALVVDDPDAPTGTWVHWVVWNIRPDTKEIKENSVPKGAVQGVNDFKKHRYGGPCPPSGTHRYFFKLYALDAMISLGPNASKTELERKMKTHVLSEAHLVGLYKRK